MTADDIAAIERATAAAVSPTALEEREGWLLAFDPGTIGRAKSAVPLHHGTADLSVLPAIEERYAAHGLAPVLRLPANEDFAEWHRLLRSRGWQEGKPTHVQVARTSDVQEVSKSAAATTSQSPDEAWASVFLGEGFDPVDGASRVATLRRAPGALFAKITEGQEAVAAGMGSFSHGWASVHGMRTALARRGQGLAGRILATLAHAARERGIERMFLQVEAHNDAALALYRRAGFETAWTYSYWKPQ